ncbi:hypothetical protein ACQ4T2_25710, partial [Escherichia coli]|uniref:hypothetical protein n=1 Tax=Escherichia coli TaxID=562 RepID=UPI003D318529
GVGSAAVSPRRVENARPTARTGFPGHASVTGKKFPIANMVKVLTLYAMTGLASAVAAVLLCLYPQATAPTKRIMSAVN